MPAAWTPEEDVKAEGLNWRRVVLRLQGRSVDATRGRWQRMEKRRTKSEHPSPRARPAAVSELTVRVASGALLPGADEKLLLATSSTERLVQTPPPAEQQLMPAPPTRPRRIEEQGALLEPCVITVEDISRHYPEIYVSSDSMTISVEDCEVARKHRQA